MPRALSALVVLMLIIAPSTAIARPPTNAPPGNSAIDEYLETVPSATGDQRPGTPGAGGGVLAPAQRQRLERLGPDGRALANAVDATATAPPRKAMPVPPAVEGRSPLPVPPAVDGRSPLSAVVVAAAGHDDGGGMGLVLPAILLATLLGVIALVVLRRRSRP
jgi:hypothetical protein